MVSLALGCVELTANFFEPYKSAGSLAPGDDRKHTRGPFGQSLCCRSQGRNAVTCLQLTLCLMPACRTSAQTGTRAALAVQACMEHVQRTLDGVGGDALRQLVDSAKAGSTQASAGTHTHAHGFVQFFAAPHFAH